jgi:hypothetical protein
LEKWRTAELSDIPVDLRSSFPAMASEVFSINTLSPEYAKERHNETELDLAK